ncbi:MAG TPA: TetR/AcrR family transcriptional regulator [Mycobacteriales bacterium]|jgi:AcrR family transcriptional regulator|nr:TetR/AcrR family transcriptional regulator [Mycobacteriales bacterium]
MTAADRVDVPAVGRRRRARRGEGDRLRGEIVEAAGRLLAETGDAHAVTLRAVARAVGVTATSIYLHFPDRANLVRALRRQCFAELVDAMDTAADAVGAEPHARARARAHAYVRFGLENSGRYGALFEPALQSSTPVDIGQSTVRGTVRDVTAALGGNVEGAEAWLVLVQFWTALHGTVALRSVRPGFGWPEVDRQVDDLVDRLTGRRAATP